MESSIGVIIKTYDKFSIIRQLQNIDIRDEETGELLGRERVQGTAGLFISDVQRPVKGATVSGLIFLTGTDKFKYASTDERYRQFFETSSPLKDFDLVISSEKWESYLNDHTSKAEMREAQPEGDGYHSKNYIENKNPWIIKHTTKDRDGVHTSEYGFLTAALFVIGGIALIVFVFRGLDSAANWFDKIQWYIKFPLLIAMVVFLSKVGKSQKWW